MYSEEWKQVIKTYEAYKESLSVFRNYDNNTADLSKSLHSRNINCYYALEALRYMPDKICIQLLDDLFHVLIYGNISYSFYAKSIILGLINNELVKTIDGLANRYSQTTTNSDEIKTIAQLLYECKNKNSRYKETYSLFSKKHLPDNVLIILSSVSYLKQKVYEKAISNLFNSQNSRGFKKKFKVYSMFLG